MYPVKMVVRGDHTLLGNTSPLIPRQCHLLFQPPRWPWFPVRLRLSYFLSVREAWLCYFPSQSMFVSRRQLHRQCLSQREGPEGAAQLCGRCQVRRERGDCSTAGSTAGTRDHQEINMSSLPDTLSYGVFIVCLLW